MTTTAVQNGEQAEQRPAGTALPKVPFPGIRPFEEDEWAIFFGREKIIEEILERLSGRRFVVIPDAGEGEVVEERLRGGRFVAIVGASGGGKSSLIKAGLFATLKHKHKRVGITWRTTTMRPAGSPMWSLAEAFYRILAPEPVAADQPAPADEVDGFRAALAQGRGAIGRMLIANHFPEGENLLLLIDQFEELFRFDNVICEAEIDLFLEQILDVVENPPDGFYIVLTMRSEYLGDCARYPRFAEALNESTYLLRRMRDTELADAIIQPARLFNGEIKPELIDRLISDTKGEHDHLPLLQHALMRLWERDSKMAADAGPRDAPLTLELADYDAVEGITGALAQHADEIYDELGKEKRRGTRLQLAARRLFQALTQISEHGRIIRRPLRFEELLAETGVAAVDLEEAIDTFRKPGRSFLMPAWPGSLHDPRTLIDISHEALVRNWNKLAGSAGEDGWLKQEQGDAEIWRRMFVRLAAFEQNPARVLNVEELQEFESFWERRRPSFAWLRRYSPAGALVAARGISARGDEEMAAILAVAAQSGSNPAEKIGRLRAMAGEHPTDLTERVNRLLESSRAGLAAAGEREHARERRLKRMKWITGGSAVVALFVLLLAAALWFKSSADALQTKASVEERAADRLERDRQFESETSLLRATGATIQTPSAAPTFIWLGADGAPTIAREQGGEPVVLRDVRAGERYRTTTEIVARSGLPQEENQRGNGYRKEPALGVVPRHTIIEIAEAPGTFQKDGKPNYWARVTGNYIIKFGTVYLQFEGADPADAEAVSSSRTRARKIAQALQKRGFEVPGEDREASARGLNEVRYYHATDREQARWLARNLPSIAKGAGLPGLDPTRIVDRSLQANKTPAGTIELWLDVGGQLAVTSPFAEKRRWAVQYVNSTQENCPGLLVVEGPAPGSAWKGYMELNCPSEVIRQSAVIIDSGSQVRIQFANPTRNGEPAWNFAADNFELVKEPSGTLTGRNTDSVGQGGPVSLSPIR